MERIHAPPSGVSISIQVYLVGEILKVCKEMEAKKQDLGSLRIQDLGSRLRISTVRPFRLRFSSECD